jgi:hypothetical protein
MTSRKRRALLSGRAGSRVWPVPCALAEVRKAALAPL